MLREYTTIVQTRLACQIEESGKLEKIKAGEYKYTNKQGAITELLEFSCDNKVTPKPGDYIVKLSSTDIYHVEKDVFEKSYRPSGFRLA
jgi:hypothetical protein